jgi:Uma2 family endonuclease
MATSPQIVTADELMRLSSEGGRYELVRGELQMMSPTGDNHGVVTAALTIRLGAFVMDHGLGATFAAEAGFHLEHDPDTVLAPDIAFVERKRFEAAGLTGKFWQGAPDLAVEVKSPGERAGEVAAKAQSWLAHGVRQDWIVDPKNRNVAVYHRDGRIIVLGEADTLEGGDVVPGFACPVRKLFPPECFS